MIDRHDYVDSVRHRLIHEEDFLPSEGELPLALLPHCQAYLTRVAWGRLWCVALVPWEAAEDDRTPEVLEALQSHLDQGYVQGPPRQGVAVLVGEGPVPEFAHAKLSVWRVDLASQQVVRGSTPMGAPPLAALERFDPVDWDSPAPTEPEPEAPRRQAPVVGRRVSFRGPDAALSLMNSSRPWATNLLLAIIWGLGVFVMLQSGGILSLFSGFPGEVLVRWGSQFAPLIITGQWWRLGTAMFLHVGLLHLALNSYALYVLGPSLEGLYGHGRFLAIYLGAGVIASATSFLAGTMHAAGASGAIFGLMGAYLYYAWYVPGSARRHLWAGIWPVLAFNFFFGITTGLVDNWGHLGGLLGGLALSSLIGLPREGLWNVRRLAGVALTVLLLAVGVPRLLAILGGAHRFLGG